MEVDGLAREAKALQERKQWIRNEDARLRKSVKEEAERKYSALRPVELVVEKASCSVIQRLQKVHIIVDDISAKAKEVAALQQPSLEPFSPHVTSLLREYPTEYETYKLDDIVVAAIAPVVGCRELWCLSTLTYSCS